MVKNKTNEIIYHVLMQHINHYQEVKKIFKIDYDSQMILVTVYAHYIYQTLKPDLKKNIDEEVGSDWNRIFSAIKNLSEKDRKYMVKLSIFSVSQVLDIPKESARRKVNQLIKKKYLDYSVKKGLSMGANYESKVKMMAPKDLLAL